MILEYDVPDRRMRHLILLHGSAIEVDVARAMRDIVREFPCPQFVRFVLTPEEWDRMRHESPCYLSLRTCSGPYSTLDRFMGIPVSIEEDPQERFLRNIEPNRIFGIDLARPGSERTVMYSGGRGGVKRYAAGMLAEAVAARRMVETLHHLSNIYGAEAAEQGLNESIVGHPDFVREQAALNAEARNRLNHADAIYRRHGGTKRPPSKLHPLVQLDESIGRNMEMGDEG